jgi:hypothetical protein
VPILRIMAPTASASPRSPGHNRSAGLHGVLWRLKILASPRRGADQRHIVSAGHIAAGPAENGEERTSGSGNALMLAGSAANQGRAFLLQGAPGAAAAAEDHFRQALEGNQPFRSMSRESRAVAVTPMRQAIADVAKPATHAPSRLVPPKPSRAAPNRTVPTNPPPKPMQE